MCAITTKAFKIKFCILHVSKSSKFNKWLAALLHCTFEDSTTGSLVRVSGWQINQCYMRTCIICVRHESLLNGLRVAFGSHFVKVPNAAGGALFPLLLVRALLVVGLAPSLGFRLHKHTVCQSERPLFIFPVIQYT